MSGRRHLVSHDLLDEQTLVQLLGDESRSAVATFANQKSAPQIQTRFELPVAMTLEATCFQNRHDVAFEFWGRYFLSGGAR